MMLYAIIRHTMRFVWRLWMRIRVVGIENVPDRGPAILLANHPSILDPLLIHCFSPRQVFSMTKSTQFRKPVMRWLLGQVGGFPTRRYQVDPQAVRVALRYLDEGRLVGIHPEGERSWDARTQPLRRGTIRLILKAGVPVIPVGLVGTYDAWPRWDRFPWLRPLVRRTPVTLRFGTPLFFGKYDDRAAREARLDETLRTVTRALEEVGQGHA